MIKLSGVIITYNEERYIESCLQSLVDVVDEIIVVDSKSTDNTKHICEKYDAIIIEQEFLGYVKQKNFALEQASFDHIVSLDGDESLSSELQKSIIELKSNWKYDGYYCNRFNNFCGQWIKYSDWYPTPKLRVFDRRKAFWDGLIVHESVSFYDVEQSETGRLKGDILHHTYQSYSEMNLKMEQFSTLSAEAYYKQGKKSSIWKILWNPSWAFFKAYFFRLGFLDGLNGFIICYQTGHRNFLKYTKLYELQNKDK
ncbi:MAG: glycosyltransferase family 2 protein [Winogradskyella sp.]|uniref:glycosyltransferase family 2 protein n=1 Tax=Winogradskyella sp. TaxID=1883156 RepID=UPI00179F9B8C|nr:glycosyltransferase family 2 protein [Winogradskyella sp.]MBT8245542.1 glycosyltransferase family 2 protein [Winogradskyella sp.]NNK23927.1 glycosyltransferase family 2 protein [Winogradskyella sp.]